MKRINKILITFLVFSFLTIYGAWRFIHSNKFSVEASKKVSEILTKKFGAKLSFTGVDFNMVPPATVFKNVHIVKMDPTSADIDLSIKELVVSFTYASFFSSNLEIDDLDLKNGVLNVQTHESKNPDIDWKNLNLKKIYEKYTQIYMQSPLHLNIAKLENIKVAIDKNRFNVTNLTFAPHRKDVRLKVSGSDIHIDPEIKAIPAFDLDEAEAQINLDKDEWKLESLKVVKGPNTITSKQTVYNFNKSLQAKGETTYSLDIANALTLYPDLPKELKSMSGQALGVIDNYGSAFDPDLGISIVLDNFKSDWIQLQKVTAEGTKKRNTLAINRMLAVNNNERYELLKSQSFFDLKKMAFLNVRVPLSVKDGFTNTFLYSIRDVLETLKGTITGKIDVVWNGEKINFEIKDKAQVKNFKLLSKSKKEILQNSGFSLEDTVLTLDKNLKLGINAKLIMNNSLVKATGEITNKDLNISIKDSKIDMQAFGPIAGLAITGAGPATAEIHGPFDDVVFDFNVNWANFSIVDLHFGNVKSIFSLSLKDLQIDIHDLVGNYNQSNFSAVGLLNFGERSGMDLKIDFKNSNFSDAKKMYNLIFKNIKLPVEPEFNFSANYRVQGGYAVDTLKIDGTIAGTDLKVLGEEAEKLDLNFTLLNNILNFKNIKVKKSRGEINANVTSNINNSYTELDGSMNGLRLSDFNFYRKLNLEYDGDLVIDFDGNGTKDNFSSRYKTRLNNTFIENIPASPSNGIFYINKDEIIVNANLLSGKMKLDSLINFKTRQISLKSNFDTSDFKEVLGVIAGHNMSEKGIAGKVKGQLNTQFNLDTLVVSKFFLDLNQFNLKKGDINLMVDPKHNSVAVDNGVVKNWDLRFSDGEDFFTSQAKNISGGIVFDQNFSIKSSLLEFVTNYVDRAIGTIKGFNQIRVDNKVTVTKFQLRGSKNSLKIKNLPGAITDLEFDVSKRGNIFEITKLFGKYGDGDLRATGVFVFDDLYPEVNIDYKIERSTIPLFKRSSLLVSSNGTITGTDLPYKLNGKVNILHGEFLDDPNDFTKENKVSLESFKKYLPQKSDAERKGYLNVNVSFDTTNQVMMKNNLAEVYAKGSGQLNGDVLSPEVNARVEVIPTVSKFKFKGRDFILNQGYVEIRDRGKARNSDLKFVGFAKINDYDVKLDIFGTIENTNIGLSSEPALAQEDLVALLTIGVTSDMSKNLEANERKSVTTVGIGTLLVDQLKINEDLNSTLGLNLSVLPEFKEDESTLVSGKSAVSEGSTNKLKSATKVKISKQVNKMVDVSVSSTVGGSIEQTQEMKINLNFTKRLSLEGVYEVKPAEEENTNTSNSIGADFKIKGSF